MKTKHLVKGKIYKNTIFPGIDVIYTGVIKAGTFTGDHNFKSSYEKHLLVCDDNQVEMYITEV